MKKIGITIVAVVLFAAGSFGWWFFSRPDRGTTGSVSTNFRWLGPNDKIVVDGFDRVLSGSPQNSVSTVPIMRWPAP